MAKVGYARVSTDEQHLDRQTDALTEQGAERIFLEKESGAKRARPELDKMLDFVRDGDTLIIESISRLARSTRDLLSIVDTLREKGVDLISMKESIDTGTPSGKFMLTIFAALSELERDTLLVRQAEGIASARKRGVHLGRPRLELPANWDEVYADWKAGKIQAVDAMDKLKVSKASFYRLVKRWEVA